jgi:hypothetical protein
MNQDYYLEFPFITPMLVKKTTLFSIVEDIITTSVKLGGELLYLVFDRINIFKKPNNKLIENGTTIIYPQYGYAIVNGHPTYVNQVMIYELNKTDPNISEV